MLGGVLFAVGNIFAKLAADEGVTGLQLVALRSVAGVIVLVPLALAESGRASQPWSAGPRWVALAPAYVAAVLCFYLALAAGDLTSVMPLAYIYPAITAAVVALLMKVPVTRRQLLAIAFGVSGAALLFGTPTLDGSGTARALALGSAAFSTVYYVGLSGLPADGRRLHGLAVLFAACSLVFVPLVVVEGDPIPLTAASVGAASVFVLLGAMVPTILVVAGVQAAGAASGATATLAEPLVLMVLAVVVLGEEPVAGALIGAALVVAGLALIATAGPPDVAGDPDELVACASHGTGTWELGDRQ